LQPCLWRTPGVHYMPVTLQVVSCATPNTFESFWRRFALVALELFDFGFSPAKPPQSWHKQIVCMSYWAEIAVVDVVTCHTPMCKTHRDITCLYVPVFMASSSNSFSLPNGSIQGEQVRLYDAFLCKNASKWILSTL
jgi:hypothetical protein